MIEAHEKNGNMVVNVMEAGETLVQWTFREHNGLWDIACTAVGLGMIGYVVTHPRKIARHTLKWTGQVARRAGKK
jgi:hypothetical protein